MILTVFVIVYLLIFSVYDLREKSLPVWLLLTGAAVIVSLSLIQNAAVSAAMGCIPGALLLVISLALPQSLGRGDGLVVMTAGAAWGFSICCRWLLLGFVLAAVFGLWKIVVRRESGKEQIALLPFLLLAAIGECLL